MSKSTVSRIITGMRAKGFVTESAHPTDGRRRVFTLVDAYLHRGDDDIQNFLDWCAKPENKLALSGPFQGQNQLVSITFQENCVAVWRHLDGADQVRESIRAEIASGTYK